MLKYDIDRDKLLSCLDSIKTAVATRVIISMLENVLIEIVDQGIRLTTTNMDVTISSKMQLSSLNVSPACYIAAPFDLLRETVNLSKSGPISLEYDPDKLSLRLVQGKSKANIKCVDPLDFPPSPQYKAGEYTIPISAALFSKMVNYTAFACSKEPMRIISGVCIETSESGTINLFATDQYRFASFEIEHETPPFSIVIPGDSLKESAKIIKTDLYIRYDLANQIAIFNDDIQIVCQRLNGTYVKYQYFKDKANEAPKTTIVCLAADLQKAVKQVLLYSMSNKDITAIHYAVLRVGENDDYLHVESVTAEAGDTSISIPATVQGSSNIIGMNCQYILDVLSVVKTEFIEISLTQSDQIGVIRETSNRLFLYAIMPVFTDYIKYRKSQVLSSVSVQAVDPEEDIPF